MLGKIEIEIQKQTLSTMDAVALIVGIVIGAGIFKTPSLIAANTGNGSIFLLTWLAGGIISVIGALCYAELATAYPHAGGDYHYLTRAFGRKIAFLFGWARMTVIQPGSITILALQAIAPPLTIFRSARSRTCRSLFMTARMAVQFGSILMPIRRSIQRPILPAISKDFCGF